MKNTPTRSFNNRRGFNLIEATLVLGIAGVVIGAVFAAWGAVSSANRLRRAEDQITVIVNQIRSTYGNRSMLDDASGATFTNALVTAGLLPDNWMENIGGVNQISNPYGGNILITPYSAPGSGARDSMEISLTHLFKDDCMKLSAHMLGTGRAEGLYKIDGAPVNNESTFQDIRGSVCQSPTLDLFYKLKTGN